MDGIFLGPFELTQGIGGGAMGRVWRGVHRASPARTPVAVKVLAAEAWRADALVAALQREVHCVAGLDHPHVVWVLDTGTIDAAASAASAGRLVAGSPYIAMEHASGGTLRDWVGRADWPLVLAVTRALLGALAHAHAREVLHRDLKPENVLLSSAGDLRPGPLLSDFGIALGADDPPEVRELVVGTRPYMAPEQESGAWRDQGPWTDLHALGHLCAELGASAPAWFTEWFERLRAPEPGRRYRDAPTARLALEDLAAGGGSRADPRYTAPPRPSVRAPPVPADWRGAVIPSAGPAPLVGAGLSLFALRPTPPYGREVEQDALWTELQRAVHQRRGRVALLRGEAGVGKSHLAQWLVHTAREIGCAEALVLRYGPEGGAEHGLAQAIRARLGVHGLDEDGRLARAPPAGARLDHWLRDAGPGHALDDALSGAIAWLAESPAAAVIVVLEDVEEAGPEALRFAELVARQATRPFLVVATAGEGAALPAWDALAAEPTGSRASLVRLAPAALRATVGHHLPLAPAVVERLVAAAAGVPLVARELLVHWIAAGELAAGEGGYALPDRPADGLEAPEAVRRLFLRRVEAAALGAPTARRALQALAVLGSPAIFAEWRVVCARIGADAPDAVQSAARRHSLVQPSDHGAQRLSSALLAASLVEAAREEGTLAAIHLACAEAVVAGPARPDRARRIGRHLLEAGHPVDAVDWLLRAGVAAIDAGHFREVDATLALVDRALAAADVPTVDVRRGRRDLLQVRLCLHRAAYDDADRLLVSLTNRWSAIDPDNEVYRHAVRLRGVVQRQRQDYDGADAFLRRAQDLSAADPPALAQVVLNRGVVARLRGGDRALTLSLLEEARDRFAALDDRSQVAACEVEIGTALLALDDDALGAVDHLCRALAILERHGRRYDVGACQLALADAYRRLRDLPSASAQWQAARATFGSIGSPAEAYALGNLAFQALREERAADARRHLEDAGAVPGHAARRSMYLAVGWLVLAAIDPAVAVEPWATRVAEHRASGLLDEECRDLLAWGLDLAVRAGREAVVDAIRA